MQISLFILIIFECIKTIVIWFAFVYCVYARVYAIYHYGYCIWMQITIWKKTLNEKKMNLSNLWFCLIIYY